MTNTKNLPFFWRRKFTLLALLLIAGVGLAIFWPSPPLQEADLLIPVEFGKIPAGLTVTGSPLKGIEVRVRGPMVLIQSLSNHKLSYKLDLSHADIGIKTLPIDKKLISLPKDLTLISVSPSALTIQIEKETTKEVPIVVTISGHPAKGFMVTSASAKPASVILRGPEDVLSGLDKIDTKPIDVQGLSESFKKEIALQLRQYIEVIFPSGFMRAEIVIAAKKITRRIKNIPVRAKNAGYRYLITPAQIQIDINGPMNSLEKLQPEKGIQVYIDLKGLKPGVYPRRAVITLPPKMTLVDVEPELFTVTIKQTKKAPKQ